MKITGSPPTECVYNGGIVFGSEQFTARFEQEDWEDIPWDAGSDLPAEQRNAAARAAVQFHYANLSHLILCGSILKHELNDTTTDHLKLAITLAPYKMTGIDTWGRYYKTVKGTSKWSPTIQEYYRKLFSEDDALTVLVAMELLGTPLAHVVLERLSTAPGTLFPGIASNIYRMEQTEKQRSIEYLGDLIESLGEENTTRLRNKRDMYRKLALNLLEDNKDIFAALDITYENMLTDVADEIDRYYDELGL